MIHSETKFFQVHSQEERAVESERGASVPACQVKGLPGEAPRETGLSGRRGGGHLTPSWRRLSCRDLYVPRLLLSEASRKGFLVQPYVCA